MGYFISTPRPKGKAEWLRDNAKGVIIPGPPRHFGDWPEGQALVVVVDNGMFEAAGYVFSQEEFEAFQIDTGRPRPRKYVLMDKGMAEEMSGYAR